MFRNKGGHLVKMLWRDMDGLAIFYKRTERGGFLYPRGSGTAVRDHARRIAAIIVGDAPSATAKATTPTSPRPKNRRS